MFLDDYKKDYLIPYLKACQAFWMVESQKPVLSRMLYFKDYFNLLQFNYYLFYKYCYGTIKAMSDYNDYNNKNLCKHLNLFEAYKLLDNNTKNIEKEYGLHPENGHCVKISETSRFYLYQINPTQKIPKVTHKPVLIIPPYVLGPNILSFLPNEQKSYIHAFANQGIPTYLRIAKDIHSAPEVQAMTGEDDVNDTAFFCQFLKKKHNQKVILNGFCQGGFMALCSVLSGKLDDLVDALITCVTPIDGTRGGSLAEYMNSLPPSFQNLNYAVKILPNGSKVIDGDIMSWVYKLKDIDREAPAVAFLNELRNAGNTNNTAAAIKYWLIYDRKDLPVNVIKLSYNSYSVPISKDGTLPIELFGQKLNLNHFKNKNIRWLLCISEKDDLVNKEVSLVPLKFINEGTEPGKIEVTVFPKGHAAIATSWPHPDTEYALNKEFLFQEKKYRGPVRFCLDLS